MVQLLERLVLCMGLHKVVEFLNTIVLNVDLEMMTPRSLLQKYGFFATNIVTEMTIQS